jgi:hypothetical protein
MLETLEASDASVAVAEDESAERLSIALNFLLETASEVDSGSDDGCLKREKS